jgi:hypothetical protein
MPKSSAGCGSAPSTQLATPKSCCAGGKRCARPRPPLGVDLDTLSEAQLERLHAGLVKLASMDDTVLAALVEHVLAGEELVSS